MNYLPIHFKVVVYDYVTIYEPTYILHKLWNLSLLYHLSFMDRYWINWLYGRFYISEFTCFLSFPPPNPIAIYWHISCKSCCDWVAIAIRGRCCEWGGTKLCCVCSALFIAIYPYISFIFSSLHFLASSIFLNDLQKYFFPNILTT